MKYPTTKNIETQIAVIDNAHKRLGKVVAELRELSLRDWKGGEMEMAGLNRAALNEVQDILAKLTTSKVPLNAMLHKTRAKDKAKNGSAKSKA